MEIPFNFVAFFLFISFIFALVKQWKGSKPVQKLPPSPWKLPIVGHMQPSFDRFPTPSCSQKISSEAWTSHALSGGENSSMVISSPRLAKEIMKTHDLAFANRAENLGTKILFFNSSDIAMAPYGDFWNKSAKYALRNFLSEKRVRSFSFIREDEALHLVESVE